MEIERKFTVERLPEELERFPRKHLEQAYLCTAPVVRVRRSDDAFFLTCKGAGLLAREEYELPLTEEAYRHLLSKADGLIIVKDRYCIPFAGYIIELDIFAPPLAPLVIAEVEFHTEAEAAAFQPPEWFGREATYEPAYSNSNLSRRGPAWAEAMEHEHIRPGRYRHFKGGEYEVLYTAVHSETLEPMVVYRALYGERGVWVRPASMWNETVTRDGVTCRRFTYIGGEEP